MLRLLGRITLGAYALTLLGCGDEPEQAPLGGGGAAGSLPAAGAGSGGAPLATAGTAGGGQAGGGMASPPDMACSSYTDDATWSLRVQIKNEMSQTLYLGQEESSCESEPLFQVADGTRTLLPALSTCRSSCETMMTTGPVTCPSACATPATVTLEPGQAVQVPWDGRFGMDFTLPQQCLLGTPASNLACVRAKRIEANIFTFSAKAGTKRQCLEPSGNCPCTPSAMGGCSSPGSLIAGTIITTELVLNLEPGEPSTSGEPPYIGLLFRDQ
jgi:hypothetical protein